MKEARIVSTYGKECRLIYSQALEVEEEDGTLIQGNGSFATVLNGVYTVRIAS
ncbi:hypothetical protein NNL21_14035 [Paenibacillus mendelii]|nr:hypothetical protein [Paenibacillus mendelii]MCQ6559816.1 hypothetical protein [Paenibacillus mendelii]